MRSTGQFLSSGIFFLLAFGAASCAAKETPAPPDAAAAPPADGGGPEEEGEADAGAVFNGPVRLLVPGDLDPGVAQAVADLESLLTKSGLEVIRGGTPAAQEQVIAVGAAIPGGPPWPEAEQALLAKTEASARACFVQEDYLLCALDGHDALGLQYAVYAFMEDLGFRPFHPLQYFEPERISIPTALRAVGAPAFAVRGFHLETSFPIEMSEVLLSASDENLALARRYVDWLVANYQNYFQWTLLRTVEFDAWQAQARQIVEYARQRGVSVGLQVSLVAQEANAYYLIDPADGAAAETQLAKSLEKLAAIPWAALAIETTPAEYAENAATETAQWIDAAAQYLAGHAPQTALFAKPPIVAQRLPAGLNSADFEFLPARCGPAAGAMQRTLLFYGLTRPAPVYGRADFQATREFLAGQAGQRQVIYQPDTSAWRAFDLSVPIFLPAYLESRWKDLDLLKGSGLRGAVASSAGWEWNYWLHDYLTARMQYDPATPWDGLVLQAFASLGQSGQDLAALITAIAQLQTQRLLYGKLIGYLAGEDYAYDLEVENQFTRHPPAASFKNIYGMEAGELQEFSDGVLWTLKQLVDSYNSYIGASRGLQDASTGQTADYAAELADSIEITGVRLAHAAALYEGALAARQEELGAAGGAADVSFAAALELSARAGEIAARRAAHYRISADRLAAPRETLTIYPYGYLYPAKIAYYFHRREKRAIDKNFGPLPDDLVEE